MDRHLPFTMALRTPSSPAEPAADTGSGAPSSTFRSLRHRNFRLFFVGQLISQTGTWMTLVTQTLLVLELTRSAVAVGLLTAFQFGPVLLLGAWAGAVADRADKRRLLIAVQALSMAQSLVLGVVVLAGWATVPVLYGLAAVKGVLNAFDNPTRRAFVVEMVPSDDLPNAVSLNSAVMTGSRVIGPAAAGALVLAVGYGWPFIIDGASYVAVIAGLLLMRPAELHRSAPAPRTPGAVREGLRHIRAEPYLLVPLVMMAIIGTFAFNFQVTVPLLVDGPLGGGPASFTLLFSVLSLGSLLGALRTARRSTVTGRQLVQAAAAFGAGMVLLALSPNLVVAFPVAVLLGVASIAFMTTSTAIVQLLAGPTFRGRVLAIQAMVFLGSTPIGGPIVGWITDAAGPRAGVVVGAVACFVAAAYGASRLDLDHLPDAPGAPVADTLPAPAAPRAALAD
jgi:MFS family permease